MSDYLLIAPLMLLVTMVAGLLYLARVPDRVDAMLVALLFGTAGVACTLTLAYALDAREAVDVALVLALLGAVVGVAFVLQRSVGAAKRESRS